MENTHAPRMTSSAREAYLISIGQPHLVSRDALYKRLLAQELSESQDMHGDNDNPAEPPAAIRPALSGAELWRQSNARLFPDRV